MAKKKKKKGDNIKYEMGAPEWMLTLGDAMSLLMTFFVLMIAFSKPKEDKLLEVLGSMQGAFNIVEMDRIDRRKKSTEGTENVPDYEEKGAEDGVKNAKASKKEDTSSVLLNKIIIEKRFFEFKKDLSSLGFKNILSMQILEDGVHFYIKHDKLLTRSGELQRGAFSILSGVVNIVGTIGNEIRLIDYVQNSGTNASDNPWGDVLKNTYTIGGILVNDFRVKSNRLGFGAEVQPLDKKKVEFEIILMNKTGTKEVTFQDFLKESKERNK